MINSSVCYFVFNYYESASFKIIIILSMFAIIYQEEKKKSAMVKQSSSINPRKTKNFRTQLYFCKKFDHIKRNNLIINIKKIGNVIRLPFMLHHNMQLMIRSHQLRTVSHMLTNKLLFNFPPFLCMDYY